jgi:hypothetical protein
VAVPRPEPSVIHAAVDIQVGLLAERADRATEPTRVVDRAMHRARTAVAVVVGAGIARPDNGVRSRGRRAHRADGSARGHPVYWRLEKRP